MDTNRLTITEFAEKYLGEIKFKGKEIKVKKCPFCGKEKWKFYLNSESGKFICHSGSCNETGTILKLKHKFGLKVNFKESISNNVNHDTVLNLSNKEQLEFKPMAEDMYKWWLEKRSITKETLDYMRVCRRGKAIVFPYLQEYELKMIKYRDYSFNSDYKKRVWQQEGGKAVLWGIDKINFEEPVILSEGEPDMLSWIESGYTNVVSVPFGTSNTDWIENNLEYIKKIKELYICFDSDDAGKKAETNIKARIGGFVKLKKITLGTYNDVNEAFVSDGKDKIIEFYEHATEYKVSGYYYGADIDVETTLPEATSFIQSVDRETGGFKFGEVVVWSAYTGSGKTTILAQMALKNISQGYRVCYYTGEDSKEDIVTKIALQLYGKDGIKEIYNNITGAMESYPTEKSREKIKKDLDKDLIILEDEVILNNIELKEKIQTALTNDNCRIFVLDNLMQIDIVKDQNENKNDLQKKFVRDLVRFARSNKIQIHLVAHNKKPDGKQNSGKTYDVSGASEIVNLAHMVLGIDRLSKENKEKLEEKNIVADASINVLKKRKRQGNGGYCLLKFDNNYQCFYDINSNNPEKIKLCKDNIVDSDELPELFKEF